MCGGAGGRAGQSADAAAGAACRAGSVCGPCGLAVLRVTTCGGAALSADMTCRASAASAVAASRQKSGALSNCNSRGGTSSVHATGERSALNTMSWEMRQHSQYCSTHNHDSTQRW